MTVSLSYIVFIILVYQVIIVFVVNTTTIKVGNCIHRCTYKVSEKIQLKFTDGAEAAMQFLMRIVNNQQP